MEDENGALLTKEYTNFQQKNSFIKIYNKNQSAFEEYSGYIRVIIIKEERVGFILCSNMLKYEKMASSRSNLIYVSKVLKILLRQKYTLPKIESCID